MPPRDPTIPDSVRRLVLTSVPSVPFLEAARLLHSDPSLVHDAKTIASALYLPRAAAESLLGQLVAVGVAAPAEEVGFFRYAPRDPELAASLAELFACYRVNLVGITNLIHDATQRSAERFANAFKLRKDR